MGSRVIAIPLPDVLPTPNLRVHHMALYRMRKELRETTALVAKSEKLPKATGKVHLVLKLIRGRGQRMLDMDNCISGLKPVCDGLVDAGVLLGDSPRWLSARYMQERGEKPCLMVGVVQ